MADDPSDSIQTLRISDFLTEESTDEYVTFWLKEVRNDVARIEHSRFSSQFNCPTVVVTDFSWLLIHASLDVFCHTDIIKYLRTTFQRCIKCDPKSVEETVIFTCSSHFISRAAKILSRVFTNKEARARQLLLSCVGLLICSPDLQTSRLIWSTIIQVFGSTSKDQSWCHHLDTLERLVEGSDNFELNQTEEDDETASVIPDLNTVNDVENKALRELSPYSAFFSNPEECSTSRNGEGDNDLYNMEALIYIFKVWLPT